jgi:uncharacterized protein YyaL (SSP411 family)
MTTLSRPELILKQIAQIRRMERGKLCLMRQGPNGPYYTHQTWEQGRNVVRYVPRDRAAALQTAIAGYQAYLELAQAYADRIIARTRQEQFTSGAPSQKPSKKRQRPTAQPPRKDSNAKKS